MSFVICLANAIVAFSYFALFYGQYPSVQCSSPYGNCLSYLPKILFRMLDIVFLFQRITDLHSKACNIELAEFVERRFNRDYDENINKSICTVL